MKSTIMSTIHFFSNLIHPIADVQMANAEERKSAGVEHRIADADYDVVQDSGDEAEKHEGDSESYHDYWVLKINDYVLKYCLLLQR